MFKILYIFARCMRVRAVPEFLTQIKSPRSTNYPNEIHNKTHSIKRVQMK